MIDLISKRHLDNIAIIDNNKIKTYNDLNKDIKEIEAIIKPRQVLILLCNNSYESLLIYLAALKCDAVPLLLSDSISEFNINEYVKRYLPTFIFSPKEIKNFSLRSQKFGNYFIYKTDNYENNLHTNLALLLTTSGSTGNPKVVKVSKNNFMSNTESICEYLNLTNKERHITTLPMNYTYGLSCINTFLCSGASIILNENAITTKDFWVNLEKYKPTQIAGVPYTYEILSKYFLEKLRFSSIKVFTQAGGKLNNEYIRKFINFSKDTKKKFIVMYGQTEATARMSYLPFDKLNEKIGSIGISIPGGSFSLRNTYRDKNNPKKTIGELVYKGDNVTSGYANSYEDLFSLKEENKQLNTGDLAWIDKDNYVYLIGRINRFAKINGIRVSLIDVEDLVKDLGYDCAISSDDINLKIYIEIGENINFDNSIVRKEIIKKINLSPNSIKLKIKKKLPRLESGKINYQKLEDNNFE